MKTTTFLVALASTSVVSASVAARDHGEHAADTTVPTPPTLTSIQLGPTESCLALCSADDVNCRASCVGGASANTDQVNQATKATASSTSSATSASGTGSRTAATSATSTRTSSASGTESAAATSSSPSSDAANGPSFVSAGSLAAIVLAFFAL
ncbi:hypothetical protein PZA11_003095 [Diplocarpon coronariae]